MFPQEAYEYALRVDAWSRKEEWLLDATALLDACEHRRDQLYLDYGTNTGTMLELMHRRGLQAIGYDSNVEAVCLGKRRLQHLYPHVRLVSQFSDLSFKSSTPYDGVVLSHVLGHLLYPQDTLTYLARKLKPHGVLAVIVPNSVYDRLMIPWNVVSGYKSDATIKHEISLSWLEKAVPKGLIIEKVFYRGETPKYLPRFMPARFRSRLMVILRKKSS